VQHGARQGERPRQTQHLHDRRESRLHEGRQQEPPPQQGHAQHYGRIHAWDRGTTLLAHGQLRGDVDSGKNGIPKGNVQNRMMEVREVALEMVPSETDERVPPLALRETSLWIYPVETALVTMYGGFNRIGRTGLLKISAAVNQAITAVQSNGDKLDADYLLPMLNFNVEHWKCVASSSRKDPNITSADIRAFRIAYPEIAEQRVIAAALSDAGALISKKHAVKAAAMHQLLTGKQRLPGFGYSEHSKKTAIGELSDDWDCHSVQDLAIWAEGAIKIGPFGSQLKWNCSALSGVKRIATLAVPKSLRRKLQEIGQDNHEYVRTHFRQSEVTRLVLLAYHEVCG
jgi:hypothetical protein